MIEGPCCAHTRVKYQPEDHPGGYRSDYWLCEDCKMRFYPADVDQRRQRLLDEFAMAVLAGWMASFGPPTGKPKVAEECYKMAEALLTEREKRMAKPCTKAS